MENLKGFSGTGWCRSRSDCNCFFLFNLTNSKKIMAGTATKATAAPIAPPTRPGEGGVDCALTASVGIGERREGMR
jgi:hypothetical protein